MRTVTMNDRETLNVIASFTRRHGYPPTQREIAERLVISRAAAQQRLQRLRRKGLVTQLDDDGVRGRTTTPNVPPALGDYQLVAVP